MLVDLLKLSAGDHKEFGCPTYDYPLKFTSRISKASHALLTRHEELLSGIDMLTNGAYVSQHAMEHAYKTAWDTTFAAEFKKMHHAKKLGQAWEASLYNSGRALRIMHWHYHKLQT